MGLLGWKLYVQQERDDHWQISKRSGTSEGESLAEKVGDLGMGWGGRCKQRTGHQTFKTEQLHMTWEEASSKGVPEAKVMDMLLMFPKTCHWKTRYGFKETVIAIPIPVSFLT